MNVVAEFLGLVLSGQPIDEYQPEHAARKASFHRLGKRVMQQLAHELKLMDVDISSCLGGIAVGGEVCMWGMLPDGSALNIEFPTWWLVNERPSFVFRHAKDLKYKQTTGNNWVLYRSLANVRATATSILNVLAGNNQVSTEIACFNFNVTQLPRVFLPAEPEEQALVGNQLSLLEG
jgi:hypothetical protein